MQLFRGAVCLRKSEKNCFVWNHTARVECVQCFFCRWTLTASAIINDSYSKERKKNFENWNKNLHAFVESNIEAVHQRHYLMPITISIRINIFFKPSYTYGSTIITQLTKPLWCLFFSWIDHNVIVIGCELKNIKCCCRSRKRSQ